MMFPVLLFRLSLIHISSVRLSPGIENIRSVSQNSTTSPSRKNAVSSEMRVACCILWVTIMIVYFHF